MFSAALQQSEDLFEAARAVGPLARPIPLFYALSQAGRGIAAAWLAKEWQIGEHGLTEVRTDETWKASGILNFKIKPQKQRGAFGAVADSVGSTGLTGQVQLGALWSALPGDSLPPGREWLLALPLWPQTYTQGQETLAKLGATQRGYVYLRDDQTPSEPKAVRALLSNYPAAADAQLETPQDIFQQGWTPWGWGPALIKSVSPDSQQPSIAGQSYWAGQLPQYKYEREHWLLPVVGDGRDELTPLLLWWALLFGLSLLARYEPVTWRAVLDPDGSELAYNLERLLEEALDITPDLLYEAITRTAMLRRARV